MHHCNESNTSFIITSHSMNFSGLWKKLWRCFSCIPQPHLTSLRRQTRLPACVHKKLHYNMKCSLLFLICLFIHYLLPPFYICGTQVPANRTVSTIAAPLPCFYLWHYETLDKPIVMSPIGFLQSLRFFFPRCCHLLVPDSPKSLPKHQITKNGQRGVAGMGWRTEIHPLS